MGLKSKLAKDILMQNIQIIKNFLLRKLNNKNLSKTYCQIINLEKIYPCFYAMTSQNINSVVFRQYSTIIQILYHQTALKLAWWLL